MSTIDEDNNQLIIREIINILKNKKKSSYFYLERLEKRARKKLINRYERPNWFYNVKIINEVLYNEKTHFVEVFKEYLIFEDNNEFLKYYYNKDLRKKKLEKILTFYDKYSKIYPNYTALVESKYIYKNIRKKQKMINQINEEKKKLMYDDEDDSKSYMKTVFNSRVINTIYTGSNTLIINKSDLTNNKSIDDLIQKINVYEEKKINDKKYEKKKKEKEKENNHSTSKEKHIKIKNCVSPSNYSNSNKIVMKKNVSKSLSKKFLENNIIKMANNSRIILKPLNVLSKKKSFSNRVLLKKKLYPSIKHSNINYKIYHSNNISIIDSSAYLSNKNKNNNNNNSNNNKINRNKNNSCKSFNKKNSIDYDLIKQKVIGTNNLSNNKILTDRFFSSPSYKKNLFFLKKKYKSKNNNINFINNNIKCINKKIISNIINKNKSFKFNKTIKRNNSNHCREEKKIFKESINNKNQKFLRNTCLDSINKLYSNNLSYLNAKNKNNKNHNIFNNKSKSKIINNYNIMNGIMNNSTQINIYTGNNLIKSLNLYWNSINSTKSPSSFHYTNSFKNNSKNKSKSKERQNKNLDLKKIIERQMKLKRNKEQPYTERNWNNEKIMKILEIYIRETKRNKSKNNKKNKNINRINKSLNSNHLEAKSFGDFHIKNNNNRNSILIKKYKQKKSSKEKK